MAVLLGIDIGTSGTKAMLFDTEDGIIGAEAQDYDVMIPCRGYAEQVPDVWWNALVEILKRLQIYYPLAFQKIEAIGLSGQMHGLVTVDKAGNVIRPAIIWLDQRSGKQQKEIEESVGMKEVAKIMHNRVFAGFAFPSLLWMKENEPEKFSRIYKIFMPKDYIRYKMTGEIGTDMSDASSTAAFNVGKRDWAWNIIEKMGIPADIFPKCYESLEIAGYITKACAEKTGLKSGIPVIYGSGDQPAYVIGTGVVTPGTMVSNIGTGGQLSIYTKEDVYDPDLKIQCFCHAVNQAYSVFGAHVSSGISLKWLKNQILKIRDFDRMNTLAERIKAGSEGLVYLPYLSGCRSPEMDPSAKGMFFGLQLKHNDQHLVRAVMEGVVYDFRRSLDIFQSLGIKSDHIIACGGGARSPVWLQMQADILNCQVQVCKVKEQACMGACIMAGAGTGILGSVDEACEQYIEMEDKVYFPIKENTSVYNEMYEIFKRLYSSNKELFCYRTDI